MKILKVYAKNCGNGMQQIRLQDVRDDYAMELFLDILKEEHQKQLYEIDKIDLNIENDEEYNEKWNEYYEKTLNKCLDYARENRENCFGDYKLVLLDDDEGIESPNGIGYYTFYEMGDK